MRGPRHALLGAWAALALLGAALAATGCSAGEEQPGEGDATIAIGISAQPDALDPALSYDPVAWESLWLAYTPLLTYRHAEGEAGSELIPGLARELPEVSGDGTRYELRLREGLEYSDGSPVRASDFEHSIKRVLAMESPGTPFFTGIVGVEGYLEEGRQSADIEGIETHDRTGEIAIRLEAPDATFENALAMTFAGLVPGDTPFRDLTKRPPPGVGPYAITSSDPGRGFVLERREGFDLAGVPAGEVARIEAEIVRDARRATEDVISGELDYIADPPAPDQLAEVRERYGDRYDEFTTTSTYYFFLNADVPPFDDPAVRAAVNAAIDKRAIARLFGGLMEPTCNVIPPNVPGYRPVEPCPWGDPAEGGDLQRGRRLVERAGAEGVEVKVWGNTEPEPERVTEYLADVLRRIGLDAKPQLVDASVYFQTISNQKTEAQTGFANFFMDFPHPANVMTIVDGDAIQPRGNPNLGNVDDPVVNARIDALRREADLGAVAEDWAALDAQVVGDAWLAPFGNRKLTTFVSERIDLEDCTLVHPLYGHDYTSFCVR
ncbi:MAG TPA: ABC transporter substrate-binding protein [Thermoleophilaceae bacterium]|nr:ABC transporter substrate-binding protein [Thermoleophilaceae bacterium]